MSNLEQAARQALEALQLCANGEDDTILTRDALSALRTALEQPEQEQEPYCWKVLGAVGEFTGYYAEQEAKATAKRIGSTCEAFPLYVAEQPAPKREWVGLTDEEIAQGLKESWVTEQAFKSAVWWAEAKLKEKNT